MENLKQQSNVFLKNLKGMPPRAVVFIFSMIFCVPFLLVLEYNSPDRKLLRELRDMEVVAYNEHSVHTLGSGNYENQTFETWKSILPLEYPGNGNWLKYKVREGAKAVSISYENVSDRIGEKIIKVHYQPFHFDESARNSIVKEKNGWTTKRYNLALIK